MIGRWHGIDQDGDAEKRAERAVLVRQLNDCGNEIVRLTEQVEEGKKLLTAHRRRWKSLMKKAEQLGLSLCLP